MLYKILELLSIIDWRCACFVWQCPMEKMRQVSPHSLEGDAGWQMRDTYSDCMKDLDKSVCCALWCRCWHLCCCCCSGSRQRVVVVAVVDGWLIDDRFHSALFSTLKQANCTFVECDSKWVTVDFYSAFFEYPTVLFGFYMAGATWNCCLHFCVQHTTMHHIIALPEKPHT